MKKFKIGDRVKLNSDGDIEMTVRQYTTDEKLYCNWFLNGELKTGEFHQDQLTGK